VSGETREFAFEIGWRSYSVRLDGRYATVSTSPWGVGVQVRDAAEIDPATGQLGDWHHGDMLREVYDRVAVGVRQLRLEEIK